MLKLCGRMVAYRASTLQIRGSNPGLCKVDSAFHPFSGLINEYRVCLGTKHWGISCQTHHLTGKSALAPQRPSSRKQGSVVLGSPIASYVTEFNSSFLV
ncbi:hypothetical protein TNCV_1922351 [Trichonephila clavipes]|nr:hypothetical protein TNCV_1922351 [Trichonephila clavipes]